MTCSTYTSQDKKELDSKLKRAIEEAGYKTRAGVVEAARFMVGAMTHKIRYLGPKKDYPELGRYYYIGINIEKNGAWGTRVNRKDKHNLPKKGEEFSLVHFYNYHSDGNLTNMWMD